MRGTVEVAVADDAEPGADLEPIDGLVTNPAERGRTARVAVHR